MKMFLMKTSSNLYLFWNIGSLIMSMMIFQIIFGFMLSMNYFSYFNDMYLNSCMIYYNLNYGWLIRFFHSNMTSMIFIMMFLHMTRSLIYKNLINQKMWLSGMLMLILLMMISFLGYSLIWSQMSYWASMVITNFIAVFPIIGNKMMYLTWGNRFINNILINRFFSIHFFMALLIFMLSLIHLIILHLNKSTNPMNLNNKIDQINLNPLLIFKDMILLLILFYFILIINMILPIKMNNPDNFNPMMMFKTPIHIEPEWYFLFFYSILRSINSKLLGLIITMKSIFMLFLLPVLNKTKFFNNKFLFMNKLLIMSIVNIMILISFIGSKPSKEPYIKIVKMLINMYFMIFLLMLIQKKMINKIN